MSWRASFVTICLAVAATCVSARGALARPAVTDSRAAPAPPETTPAERLAAEQAAYDHAPDPVAKAKALAKLEPGVFAQARKTLDDGDDVGTLAQLQQFRDETNATMASLEAIGASAQNHPAGFRELQIALREALRQMDDIILSLPPDKHPWFKDVRSDLADAQNELIDLLFPRQPRKAPTANRPPS
jgi:hypothetical protein